MPNGNVVAAAMLVILLTITSLGTVHSFAAHDLQARADADIELRQLETARTMKILTSQVQAAQEHGAAERTQHHAPTWR